MASLVSSQFTLPSSKPDQLSSLSQKHFFLDSFLPKKTNSQPNSKSSLKVKCAAIGNGLFTQTTLEVRRIVPENKDNLPTVKFVYVVLEAQYQSSLSSAVQSLNLNSNFASFQVVGYLVEELRDENTYKTFCKDLEDANIFIGSLIFVEELALRVKAAVEKERDRFDAVLVFPSMPEVMRLNKLGSFSMSQLGQSKSPFFQLFKRKNDRAQYARLYILSLKFWLGGSPDNLQNFLKMISGFYVPALKGTKEHLNWYGTRRDVNEKLRGPNAPVVGLVLQRSHIVTGDESHYVAVIMELRGFRGKIDTDFAGGLDFSGPVERFLIDPVTKKPMVNSVVSLTGFALVGGPARQDHPRAVKALMKLDVPYIVALPFGFFKQRRSG
ncbi:hypothetical protein CRYUN_Cryun16bG0076500 [Craigia yunnanensis]